MVLHSRHSVWSADEVADDCLLLRHYRALHTPAWATQLKRSERARLRRSMERLLDQGYTLRAQFPGVPVPLYHEWIGKRLVLGHSRSFNAEVIRTSIVSSRLGRYGRLLEQWPTLLETLLRSIRRSGAIYLAVSGTTVDPLLAPLLARSAVACERVSLPASDEEDISSWLCAKANELTTACRRSEEQWHLSPPLSRACGPLERLPLRDRIAIGCAHNVRALVLRPHGTTSQLISARLADPRFRAGTVSVWIPSPHDFSGPSTRARTLNRTDQLAWLERGAIGWYVPPRPPPCSPFGCAQRSTRGTALWQLTTKYSLSRAEAAGLEAETKQDVVPRYLVHCVRGWQGLLPHNAAGELLDRMWVVGPTLNESPLATLVKILDSGVLRGGAALNRTGEACVSFSAVPLGHLIPRRTYQPHLGRWDWEPFGLRIDRRALEELGARPVIYGDGEVFQQLGPGEKAFFQPAQRRRRADSQRGDWREECEWRMVGDVRLHDLPYSTVQIFVAFQHQAQALASHSAWPVIWLQDAQTRALPGGSSRRRRREVRTSRS